MQEGTYIAIDLKPYREDDLPCCLAFPESLRHPRQAEAL